MTINKKLSWFLLYLAAFIPVGFSIHYFSEKNLLLSFVTFFISMLIYTFLIFKNIRFLSLVAFITMSLAVMVILGDVGKQADDAFPNISDERIFILTRSLIILFLLINSVFLAKIKRGFKKLIPLFFVVLSVLMLIAFMAYPPAYYQNFAYMLGNTLIILIFSIFSIIKKKKVLGILGILLSVVILLQSTKIFNQKAYALNDKKQKEVIEYVDPIVKEMYGYYNKKDYANFCKYCRLVLKNMMDKDPITIEDKREMSGPYVYFGESIKVVRKSSRYYVEYPVKFEKIENLMYLTFAIESISADDPSIYGYGLSEKQGLHTNSGNENERDK